METNKNTWAKVGTGAVEIDPTLPFPPFDSLVKEYKNNKDSNERRIRTFVVGLVNGLQSDDGNLYLTKAVELYKKDKAFSLDQLNTSYIELCMTYNEDIADAVTSLHALLHRMGINPKGFQKGINVEAVLTMNGLSKVKHLFLK